jgi:hypothetical protein
MYGVADQVRRYTGKTGISEAFLQAGARKAAGQ